MYLAITPQELHLPPGAKVQLQYQTWADYETMLQQRVDRAGLRIRYNARTQLLTLMAPLPGHGKRAQTLADLVKCLLRRQGQDWEAYDPITLKQIDEAGVEPDVCFYVQHREAVLGKERIDLAIDPPPDLALEIDLTSTTRPEDYAPLKVPEVWIYRRQSLLIYGFSGIGYEEMNQSILLPNFSVKSLMPQFVERAWLAGSSVALREFEALLDG
jgi:Uma2 family endonuclease